MQKNNLINSASFHDLKKKNPLGVEACILNLAKDPDSRAYTILNIENFPIEINIRFSIASIQHFIAIPKQGRRSRKRNKMLKGMEEIKLYL